MCALVYPFCCLHGLSVRIGPANSRTSEDLDAGCFGKHLDRSSPNPALRKKVAASLVFLADLRNEGNLMTSGMWFFAKGSALAGGMASHITAMSLKPGAVSLTAFSSAGAHLGTAKIIVLGDKAMKPELDTYGGSRDVAVLSIIPDDAKDDAPYLVIEESNIRPPSLVRGPISASMGSEETTGIGEGDSGSPWTMHKGLYSVPCLK